MDTDKPDMKKDLLYFAVLIICLFTLKDGCSKSSAQQKTNFSGESQAAIELKVFQDKRAAIVDFHLSPEAKKRNCRI